MTKLSTDEILQAVNDAAAQPPERLDAEVLEKADCWRLVAILPNQFDRRIRYLGDVLAQATMSKPDDPKLRAVTTTLCQTLSYLLNSSSWKDGEMHGFDLQEIRSKLRRVL